MRISVFSALYPPEIIGGAEIAADNLNRELVSLGHVVSVLTTAQFDDPMRYSDDVGAPVAIERVYMPRPYPAMEYMDQSHLKKAIWHVEDHVAPFNFELWVDFVRRTKPDAAIVQVAQGLGFNGLRALALEDVPTVYVLHDLSLACYRTSMFKNGHNCETLCFLCARSSAWKAELVAKFPRLGFVSPSKANLERVGQFIPVKKYRNRVILNPIRYPSATLAREYDDTINFLYVGQITQQKGVEFLIETYVKLLPSVKPTRLTIVGSGPDLDRLKRVYGSHPNIVFTGKVDLQAVANYMKASDVLCVPSLWQENSPGVVVQALCAGLPVIASRNGGLVELVEHNQTGLLLESGDSDIWTDALSKLLIDESTFRRWSANAALQAPRFDPVNLAHEYIEFINEVVGASS